MSKGKLWNEVPDLVSTTPFQIEEFETYCNKKTFPILDVGCGYGRILKKLEHAGYRNLHGIDNSEIQISRAKAQTKYSRYSIGDALRLPFNAHSFNTIISFGLINNIIKSSDVEKIIQQIHTLLQENGYWFINLYSVNYCNYFKFKYQDGFDLFGKWGVFCSKNGFVYRHYKIEKFFSLTVDKFEIIKCEKKDFLSMNQTRNVNGFSIILKKIEPIKALQWTLKN